MKIIKTAAWVYYLSDAQYQMIVEQQQDIDDYEEILMGKWLIFCGKYEDDPFHYKVFLRMFFGTNSELQG